MAFHSESLIFLSIDSMDNFMIYKKKYIDSLLSSIQHIHSNHTKPLQWEVT